MGTTSSCKYLVFTNCTGKQLFGDAEGVLPICALLPSAKGNFFLFFESMHTSLISGPILFLQEISQPKVSIAFSGHR